MADLTPERPDTKRLRDLRERADALIDYSARVVDRHDLIEVVKLISQMASALPALLDEVDALREVARLAGVRARRTCDACDGEKTGRLAGRDGPCSWCDGRGYRVCDAGLEAALAKLEEVRRGA